MHMYMCMYMHMYMYMYVYVYIHSRVRVCVRVFVCARAHTLQRLSQSGHHTHNISYMYITTSFFAAAY